MSRSLTFPFHIGDLGAPATSPRSLTIRQQLEQLLFTIPGERVNRPTFGCGVQRLVFGGCSPETAAAAQYIIRINIQEFMGELVIVDAVRVASDPPSATLYVDILYTLRETGEERAETFRRTLEAPP
ncbi:MAG TPA: GPW/gp25 family protein [Kofleriaceae bacterium]|nr:GPW/gp25 family protein [Kofleriaceae bacterium]